jgi:uncharacterized membrane protein YhiD involved in acid resistance
MKGAFYMLKSLFKGLFDSGSTYVISVSDFLLCVGCALILGIIFAAAYMYRSKYTKSFALTLAILPAAVCVVIMMVNGNIGTGVAVAGAFSLVRFRSMPGNAKDIGMILLTMGAGLISGMGYLAYAVLFTVIMCAVSILYEKLGSRLKNRSSLYKTMNITIPEDLNYTGVFDDLMKEYTSESELVAVKTTNMGSLFRLTYDIKLKDEGSEKDFIDKLRCRNGNLEITIARQSTPVTEL